MKSLRHFAFLSYLLLSGFAVASVAAQREIVVPGDTPVKATDMPYLGNGQLGVVPTLDGLGVQRCFSVTVHERGSDKGVSHIRPVMSPVALEVLPQSEANELKVVERRLDMTHAVYETRLKSPEMEVVSRIRTLRGLPFVTLCDVEVKALRNVEVRFVNRVKIDSRDSVFAESRPVRVERIRWPMSRRQLHYNGGDEAVVSTTAIVCGEGCRAEGADTIAVELKKGASTGFAVVVATCSTEDFSDAWQESERQVIYAVKEGVRNLVANHERLWDELWQSDITIDGDDDLQAVVTSSLYNLYSSIREGGRHSIAPMGQSSKGYNGHIFWDADTWIFPVLAVMNPGLARSMVDFRVDCLEPAKKRALAYCYRGAMFPWEADPLGEESTPTFALTGPLEHHIVADVANAVWQYYCVTGDKEWLRKEGWPVMRECADFWVSRVVPNGDGSYSVRNVVGADEYAIGVDDNAFTNGAAKVALKNAVEAARVLGDNPDPLWDEVASHIKFHYFPDGVMREHATYDGAKIKQGDVTLLGYPLGVMTDRDELLKNLNYYDTKLDPVNGPAMGRGVMAVSLSRLGMGEKAGNTLTKAYVPHLRGPFLVFAETPKNNATYFMTGAAALLQGVIFGYGGIDITSDGIRQVSSTLPKGVRSVRITTPLGVFECVNVKK